MSGASLWTREAAKRYLNDYPLPTDFRWPHTDGGERIVHPVHGSVMAYGKWLAEGPSFPGLFELVVDILNDVAISKDPGDGAWMAEQLSDLRKRHEKNLPGGPAALAHKLRPFVGAIVQPTLAGLN